MCSFNRACCAVALIILHDTYITYCIIDYFECRLLVVVIHSAVAMENRHALLFGPFAITAVHTVIWPVVPLAGEDEETLCKKRNTGETVYLLYYTWT